jgi:hypothetical protein
MTGNLKKRGGFSLFGKKEMGPSEPINNVNELVLGLLNPDSFISFTGYKGRTEHTPKEFYPRYYVDFEKNKGMEYVYSGLEQEKDKEGNPIGKYYLNFNQVYRNKHGNTDYTEIGFNKNNAKPQHIYLDTTDKNTAENMNISDKKIFVTNDSMQMYKNIKKYFDENKDNKGADRPQYARLRYYGGKKRRTKKRKSMKKKQRKTKRRKSLKKRKSIKKRKA